MKKLQQQILNLVQNCANCSDKNIANTQDISTIGLCSKCSAYTTAFHRYFNSNIPVLYWDLSIPSDPDNIGNFKGAKGLIEVYTKAIADLNKSYTNGMAFCLAGTLGVGKSTTVANILKKACHKNFTVLYTNLGDIVNALISAPSEDKYLARKELTEIDFLVIDEFDSRHIGNTEIASDLFGRTLEFVVRIRLQNKLPIILVSNSPNPSETFTGAIKESVSSLLAKIPIVPIIGQDIRKLQESKIQ